MTTTCTTASTYLLNGFGRLDRDSGLLNDDLGRSRDRGDHPGGTFPVGQVGGLASAHPARLGGGVDTDKNDVGLGDMAFHIRGEEEVTPAAGLHNIIQTGLVNGELIRVPGCDACLVDVQHNNLNLWALQCDLQEMIQTLPMTCPTQQNKIGFADQQLAIAMVGPPAQC